MTVARPATAIGAFMAGAAIAAVVLKWLAERGRAWFHAGLVCEAVLLVCAGAMTLWRHGTEAAGSDHGIVALVALAMRVRASTALRVHVPGMPTLLSQTAIAELINDVLKRLGRRCAGCRLGSGWPGPGGRPPWAESSPAGCCARCSSRRPRWPYLRDGRRGAAEPAVPPSTEGSVEYVDRERPGLSSSPEAEVRRHETYAT
ncbi:hypothetical protein GCM10010304_64680 [Streptomyces roseoviolaceus]